MSSRSRLVGNKGARVDGKVGDERFVDVEDLQELISNLKVP